MISGWPDRAQHGRAEEDAAEQLAHHGRLAGALHEFAHEPANHHQQPDLDDEDQCRGIGRVSHACALSYMILVAEMPS